LAEYIGALEHNLRSSLESHDLVDPAESVALLDDLRSESL